MTSPGHEPAQFGRYRILDKLGEGGMSTVHLAEISDDTGSTKMVALKRLLPRAAARKELRDSFVREARLTRYLDQQNIPKTYESGKLNGTYFISMEFVPGNTLKELVEHCADTVGTVPTEITLNIAAQICEALDHAHNRRDEHDKALGIVHRDVSPSNIILSEAGVVKLIDFGLAKTKISSVATGEGMIKGKFNYVAPEYLGGTLDARADLWALGVVMYELLTGRRLFDGPDPFETMNRVRKLPIPPASRANPRVTPELDRIVMTALERDPDQRWQSAAKLREALLGVIAQPGNQVDNAHVIDWVNWAFSQLPGTQESGVSKLQSITGPTPILDEAPEETSLRPRGTAWIRRMLSPRSKR